MARSWAVVVLLSVLAFGLVGCQQERAWVYQAGPRAGCTPAMNVSLVVPPFSDARENVNKNRIIMGYIPLVPYGWQDFSVPESPAMHMTSGRWTFNPKEDFAKAVAAELENAVVFREAFFSYKRSDGDLVLDGTIDSTQYNGKLYTYCISAFGPYLWFIGAPAGSMSNELALDLRITDQRNQRVVWSGSYKRQRSAVTWIYGMKPDFTYDIMLKSIMKEALPQIRAAVQSAADRP
jgi:hypothetical protein